MRRAYSSKLCGGVVCVLLAAISTHLRDMGVAPSLAGFLTTTCFHSTENDPCLPPSPPPSLPLFSLCSNCLFRALATQLGERGVSYQSLRRDVVHYMRQNPEQFEAFLTEEDESYEEYSKHVVVVLTRELL